MRLKIFLFTILFFTFTNAQAAQEAVYKNIFDNVNKVSLLTTLQKLTGYIPVTVNGETYSITNRYTPAAKAKFRAYWAQYFTELGMVVTEQAYTTRVRVGEDQGHNLEAILPGQSKDSIVIIVHYDSMGSYGQEALNPAVDDCMTGMAISMETARLLAPLRGQLKNTIRFVAADYEEHAYPGLEGARQYAAYIKDLSQREGFKIVAAVDNEQTGWNCANTNECSNNSDGNTFDVYSCSGDSKNFNYQSLGDLLVEVVTDYSSMHTVRDCIGQHSDHYAMWEIGVPAVVYAEHEPFNNPHFDQNGGDTYDKIDQNYFFKIAQVGVTFAATLAGLE